MKQGIYPKIIRGQIMYKFILSTDSTCDLYADFVKENDIRFVSLNFVFEENGQFTEGVDAFTDYSQYVDFYNRLRGGAFSRGCGPEPGPGGPADPEPGGLYPPYAGGREFCLLRHRKGSG